MCASLCQNYLNEPVRPENSIWAGLEIHEGQRNQYDSNIARR